MSKTSYILRTDAQFKHGDALLNRQVNPKYKGIAFTVLKQHINCSNVVRCFEYNVLRSEQQKNISHA